MSQSPHDVDHYADRYWNDLPRVVEYMSLKATGDPDLWWTPYIKHQYATPPLDRALVIACGNGWLERELFDLEVARHFDAFDSNPSYLQEARRLQGDRSIRYSQATFTTFELEDKYDLALNVAALHHAQYLFNCTQRLADCLAPDGLLISWDYVGPSRNQYSHEHLAVIREINQSLPRRFRSQHSLRLPLRTFLARDRTEAVHSSEIHRAIDRYFEILEWRELCGGVAYPILWNNIAEFEKGDREAAETLERLLWLDSEFTQRGLVPNLFVFAVARPRPGPAHLGSAYDRYVREPVREAISRWLLRGYYPGEIRRRLSR